MKKILSWLRSQHQSEKDYLLLWIVNNLIDEYRYSQAGPEEEREKGVIDWSDFRKFIYK